MNEWSPGGSYSRPGTPNQAGRLYKPQWDESEKGTKPLIVNPRTSTDIKPKSFHQYSMEDVTSVVSSGTKNKKGGSGASDPRFKRVIPGGVQNDACVGTERKTSKPNLVKSDKDCAKLKVPIWSSAESMLSQGKNESANNSGTTKPSPEALGVENPSPVGLSAVDQSQDPMNAVDKLAFSHDIIVKSFSKESLTDSTINTRNTSLASEDLGDEFSNDLSIFPSATRVKKVQNWILEQKSKPDKKQSVVTVIGQTQDAMSSALREIDKRRKLVKELDKYAVCRKIIETDKEKEISDLVAQISSLSNGGKIKNIEKEINISCKNPAARNSEDKLDKNVEKADCGHNESNLSNDPTNDSGSPTVILRKSSSTKKKSKKYYESRKFIFRGKLGQLFSRSQYQGIFCILFVLTGILCWITLNTLQHMPCVSFDLFSPKPKPMTWYEKISMWAWELFRPSANYRRTAPWNSF